MSSAQLVFDLAGQPSLAAEDFLPAPGNQDALGWVARWPAWPSFALTIWGPEGAGKTHLAHILAARAQGAVVAAGLLTDPAALAARPLVAVEDADRGVDETLLFHLFNAVREAGHHLLLTGRQPPARWGVALPDLSSRLATVPTVALSGIDDTLLRALLLKQFADRRLAPEADVIDYLVGHMERSFAAARAVVAELDRAALAQKRGITTRLAGEVLTGMAGQGELEL